MANSHRNTNAISSLVIDEDSSTCPNAIRNHAVFFYESLLKNSRSVTLFWMAFVSMLSLEMRQSGWIILLRCRRLSWWWRVVKGIKPLTLTDSLRPFINIVGMLWSMMFLRSVRSFMTIVSLSRAQMLASYPLFQRSMGPQILRIVVLLALLVVCIKSCPSLWQIG